MIFFRVLKIYFLQFLCAANLFAASNLSTTTEWNARKINIQMEVEDRSGKSLIAIPLNQLVRLRVNIEALDGQPIKELKLVKFDAQMPAHRHGMVTKATISEVKPQQYLIEGVKLHMPGIWKLIFDLKDNKQASQVAISLNL